MNDARFWTQHGLLPVLLFLLLLLAFEFWPLDFWVADHFYNTDSGFWLGGGSWWAKGLIHKGGARLIMAVFVACLALWLATFRFDQLGFWRRPALFVGTGILVCTSLVALLKHYTNVDCPEELARYGGDRLYVHVFSAKPDGAARGACFPGGHSSGAFSLMAFYFLLRESRPRWAGRALMIALLLGGIYAAGQWTRGEHFPSHDVWSAFICWYVLLTIYMMCFRGRMFGVFPDSQEGSA